MEVQLRLFTEQMEYQRERDRRLSDHARMTIENAKLAIEKQADVVHCLAHLSTVITAGLQQRQAKATDATSMAIGVPVQNERPTPPDASALPLISSPSRHPSMP